MAWRVLLNGAMLEVVNGVSGGREMTSTAIYRQGQVIERDLPKSYVQRYLADDPTVRSTVEYGRVDVSNDDDGNEVREFVATSGPDVDSAESAGTVERAEDAEGEVTDLRSRVAELEGQLSEAQASASAAASESSAEVDRLNAQVDELKTQLAEAEEAATSAQGLSYSDLSAEALAVEADKRGVTPETGSGANGNVLKSDLVKALEGDSTSS